MKLRHHSAVENVLRYHQLELVRFIHAQMQEHQNLHQVEYEVKISQGYTSLKEMAYTATEGKDHLDARDTNFDKTKMGRIIFTGFKKSLYPLVKFDSDTERRFALILERDSLKWFKPARGQFQIHYQYGGEHSEYVPDFVAETAKAFYMIETKAKDELASPEVQAKKAAALKWCTHASDFNTQHNHKPWKYLLIPHDQVQDNMGLEYFEFM